MCTKNLSPQVIVNDPPLCNVTSVITHEPPLSRITYTTSFPMIKSPNICLQIHPIM